MVVNLTNKEIEMIDIGLYVACHECQLPDEGEEGYLDIIALRRKLGIYDKDGVVTLSKEEYEKLLEYKAMYEDLCR